MKIAKARISRTEIIEGNAHAKGLKLLDVGASGFPVIEQCGFRDLQFKSVRRESRTGKRCRYIVHHRRPMEILRRQIDGDADVFRPPGALLAGGLQHHATDLGYKTHFLGERNENGWRDRTQLRMLPPTKRFISGNTKRRHVDDWLVHDMETSLLDCRAQVRLHR